MKNMLKKMILVLEQRLCLQSFERMPESSSEITDKEFIKNFIIEAEKGNLDVLYRYIVESVSKLSLDASNALDIGCGPATLLCQMARKLSGTQFTAIDMSSVMIEIAKENAEKSGVKNISFMCKSWFELKDFEDHSYDIVTWNLALHHCDNKNEVVQVINSISKILKPSGKLFIFDVLRPCSERNMTWFLDSFINNKNPAYFQNVLESFRAGYTFGEIEEILSQSLFKSYTHIEPLLMNYWQVVICNKEPHVLEKKSFVSELEYRLFKFFMKYPVRRKVF